MRLSIIILSLLIMFGGCKSKPEVVTDTIKEAHIITKSKSELDTATVYRFIAVEPTHDTVIQVKKIVWNGGGEPTYTVVLGMGSINSMINIDTEVYWGKSLKPEYVKQQYYENSNMPFGVKYLFISGIEIVFKDRYQLQALNLSQNPAYIDFNRGYTCTFILPHTLWQDALDYILY